jgi:hypothetical protein
MAEIRRYVVSYKRWLRWEIDPNNGPYAGPIDIWSDERQIDLEAFDAIEARQRLEFKLRREGSMRPGQGDTVAYLLLDIAPCDRVPA